MFNSQGPETREIINQKEATLESESEYKEKFAILTKETRERSLGSNWERGNSHPLSKTLGSSKDQQRYGS